MQRLVTGNTRLYDVDAAVSRMCSTSAAGVVLDKPAATWHNPDMPDTSIACNPSEALHLLYVVRERDAELIQRMMDADHAILPMLYELAGAVGRYFLKHRLTLQAFIDPEEDAEPSLSVVVHTALAPRAAVAQRARLIDEWWIPLTEKHGHRPISILLTKLIDNV